MANKGGHRRFGSIRKLPSGRYQIRYPGPDGRLRARDIARALVEAGFTLHHCARHHPLYRLGGVCLLPVARGHDPNGKGGVVVSWTTHDLLSIDGNRWSEYHGAHEVMNGALAQVLDALGYQVRPFGPGGAWIVTGRASDEEARR